MLCASSGEGGGSCRSAGLGEGTSTGAFDLSASVEERVKGVGEGARSETSSEVTRPTAASLVWRVGFEVPLLYIG